MLTAEVYQHDDGTWDWRVRSQNGNIIATSGQQGYENQTDCAAMLHHVTGSGQAIPVTFTPHPAHA